MKTYLAIVLLSISVFFGSCIKQKADLVVQNAKVYTVDNDFNTAESFAVKNGKILEVGSNEEISSKYVGIQILDLNGQTVLPGLVDPHCHYFGYGLSLQHADLVGTTSFEEIIKVLVRHHNSFPSEWILGRGWDQNDWAVKEFPTKEQLDAVFPDIPVFLKRIDGHGAIANSEALRRAGVTNASRIEGGQLIMENGEITGVLIDNAMELVESIVPDPTHIEIINGLLNAQSNCFAVGLTAVHDAGLSKDIIQLMDSLQLDGSLKMRIYAMLNPTQVNFDHFVANGIYETDRMFVRSIKLYADGALGSRGALMLDSYSDDAGNFGLLVNEIDRITSICQMAFESGYQVNTHCIGDSANRLILNIYKGILGGKNDKRWRIEHAQIIHPEDFNLFGEYNIVPSIQSTHGTSDMYWAEDRIGPDRIRGAYAYKQLLNENGWLPNGSDFPVEHINPLYGFYAAVARKDHSSWPQEGFQMENALSREEALRAMTIWAAKSGFGEGLYGSIEPGKFADFVVLKEDIMNCDIHLVPKIKIMKTYVQGEEVYSYNPGSTL